MAKIPREVIDDIQSRIDIVDLVGRYVPLKRAGVNFKGNCPFHKENTPSFIVSPAKQIYHCFGCHAGGNGYSFLMEYDKLNFIEAVKKLSVEAGIDVQKYLDGDREESSIRGKMYELNSLAMNEFHTALKSSTAFDYMKLRKFTDEIIDKFKVGFAPDSWNFLTQKLPPFDHETATKIGLLAKYDNKPIYDKFRNRIIFPIFSSSNQVLGFGGRRLNEEQNPKYLNSPESEIYNKRSILYGLSHAIKAIRSEESCYLVEGYMDVIRCHQFGIENVVASSGTALTEGHARLLARYCKKITVMFDSDNAGIDAAIRSIPILLNQNFTLKIIPMPKGSDPDTILIKHGREKFESFVEKGYDFVEFQTRLFKKRGLLESNEGKTSLVKQVSEQINSISDSVLREMYLNDYSHNTKLFNMDLRNIKPTPEPIFRKEPTELTDDRIEKIMQYIHAPEFNKELKIIGWLLNVEKELQSQIIQHINPTFFKNKILARILSKITEQFDDSGIIDISSLINEDKSQLFGKIISSFNGEEYLNAEKFVNDAIYNFKLDAIKNEISELQKSPDNQSIPRIVELQKEKDKLVQSKSYTT